MYGEDKFLAPEDDLSKVTITVGGRACPVTNANTVGSVTTLTCTLPWLPAGDWPVVVSVAGRGVARAPETATKVVPSLSVPIAALRSPAPAAVAGQSCLLGMWGGGLLTIAGNGLVEGVANEALARRMEVMWSLPVADAAFYGRPSPVRTAVEGGRLALSIAGAAAGSATVRLARYTVPDVDLYAGNNTIRSSLRWAVRVNNTAVVPQTTAGTGNAVSPPLRASQGSGCMYTCIAGSMLHCGPCYVDWVPQ